MRPKSRQIVATMFCESTIWWNYFFRTFINLLLFVIVLCIRKSTFNWYNNIHSHKMKKIILYPKGSIFYMNSLRWTSAYLIDVMSKSNPKYDKCEPCCRRVLKLEQTVVNLQRTEKENEYVILTYRAQICLLHGALKKIKKASKNVLYEEAGMLEILESCIERGIDLKHNSEDIYYPGEETPKEYRKRKASSSACTSSSDSSSKYHNFNNIPTRPNLSFNTYITTIILNCMT